jgi:hypothetical protein
MRQLRDKMGNSVKYSHENWYEKREQATGKELKRRHISEDMSSFRDEAKHHKDHLQPKSKL